MPPYRLPGFDPAIFPKGRVPFKKINLNSNGDNRHTVAAMWYAMAHRSGNVEGPPFGIATLDLSDEGVVKGIWDQTLFVAPEQSSLNFCKPITMENYEGLADIPLLQNIENGESLLQLGYALLSKKKR